jgi:hypothetical protein
VWPVLLVRNLSKPVHRYSAELLLPRDVMDGLDATSAAYAVGYESGDNSAESTADSSTNRPFETSTL